MIESWLGGNPECQHVKEKNSFCTCGAWWGQLGQEQTPRMYVEHLVEVFSEVFRTLRPDGTLWLNLGDSYANDEKWGGATSGKHASALHGQTKVGRNRRATGIAPKNLIGVPWMAAFALREAGWTIRSEVIWEKPNAMPESVEDRPTRSHEHVFLLTKNPTYFYDAAAIRDSRIVNGEQKSRNKRSVWPINTQPYQGAHFAVMAPDVARTCIKAGSRPGDLVLDPFAGSGTTLATAVDLDRDFLGVEINESYRPLIEERTEAALSAARQRALYNLAIDEPV